MQYHILPFFYIGAGILAAGTARPYGTFAFGAHGCFRFNFMWGFVYWCVPNLIGIRLGPKKSPPLVNSQGSLEAPWGDSQGFIVLLGAHGDPLEFLEIYIDANF